MTHASVFTDKLGLDRRFVRLHARSSSRARPHTPKHHHRTSVPLGVPAPYRGSPLVFLLRFPYPVTPPPLARTLAYVPPSGLSVPEGDLCALHGNPGGGSEMGRIKKKRRQSEVKRHRVPVPAGIRQGRSQVFAQELGNVETVNKRCNRNANGKTREK